MNRVSRAVIRWKNVGDLRDLFIRKRFLFILFNSTDHQDHPRFSNGSRPGSHRSRRTTQHSIVKPLMAANHTLRCALACASGECPGTSVQLLSLARCPVVPLIVPVCVYVCVYVCLCVCPARAPVRYLALNLVARSSSQHPVVPLVFHWLYCLQRVPGYLGPDPCKMFIA